MRRQASVVGWRALAYGGFVRLFALIWNPGSGRLAFVGCGTVVVMVGVLLLRAAKRVRKRHPDRAGD